MGKNNRLFDSIMSSLEEIKDWTDGKGEVRVTRPGEKPRDMTFEEYEKGENHARDEAKPSVDPEG